MNRKKSQKNYGVFTLALLLLACGFPSLTAPVQISDSQSIDQLGTVIANTAAAAQTQTATVQPSPTFTLTPSVTPTQATPLPTFFFSLFTATAAVPFETTDPEYSSEDSGTFSGGGLSGANDPIPYSGRPWSCIGAGKYPPNHAVVAAGKSFTATWTVINTGTKTWTSTTVDFAYKSGYRHDGKNIQDLSSTVAPGRKAIFKVQFTAPRRAGEYSTIWTMKVGSRTFCGITFNFEVKK